MAYCTQADLIDRYGESEIRELTDREGLGEIDPVVVERAIADAGGEIDGYLAAGGYALPLATTPAILAAYACDIARYRLYGNAPPDATEGPGRRYADAVRFLREVSRGVVRLGFSAAPPEQEAEVQYDFAPRAVTDDELRGF